MPSTSYLFLGCIRSIGEHVRGYWKLDGTAREEFSFRIYVLRVTFYLVRSRDPYRRACLRLINWLPTLEGPKKYQKMEQLIHGLTG